jgi:DnaJ-class molecular chaperone
MKDKIICSNCLGNGYIPNDDGISVEICVQCKGTGEIRNNEERK